MPKSALKDHQKDEIHDKYATGHWTQDDLALAYAVSRRTINRTLLAAGMITPRNEVSPAEMEMVELLRSRNIHNVIALGNALKPKQAASSGRGVLRDILRV